MDMSHQHHGNMMGGGPSVLSAGMGGQQLPRLTSGAMTGANANYNIEVDEVKFFQILQNVAHPLTEKKEQEEESLDWLLSLEVYDLLDSSITDRLGFREFCVFIFLIAASSDFLLTQCLFDHGPLIFDILSAGQPIITGERLKALGKRVLAIHEEIIDDIANGQGLKYSSMVGFEEFQVFYFEVFQLVDESKPPSQ